MLPEPTRLDELRRTDSAVRLRCTTCAREHVLDREVLIRRLGSGASATLAELQTWCDARDCEGPAMFAAVVAASDDPANARRRAAELALANLACRVLQAAAYSRATKPEEQTPVRLALRVAQALGAETQLCTRYWNKVTVAGGRPWEGCHNECGWIVLSLVKAGHNIAAELRP